MGCRILHDEQNDLACLYCSTSDHAFGPVFWADKGHGAGERLEAFLRWTQNTPTWPTYENSGVGRGRDPRSLTDAGLSRAYADWLAQEAAQWAAEEHDPCPTCGSREGCYVPAGSGDALCLHCGADWPSVAE